MNELKPCPFCGGKADMITNDGRTKAEKLRYHPCCHNQQCIMFVGGIWFNTEKEAIEAWNRRSDNV